MLTAESGKGAICGQSVNFADVTYRITVLIKQRTKQLIHRIQTALDRRPTLVCIPQTMRD